AAPHFSASTTRPSTSMSWATAPRSSCGSASEASYESKVQSQEPGRSGLPTLDLGPWTGANVVSVALAGIRVLDLSQVAIGPYATFLLAGLGAQVIKVESHRRADVSRGAVKPATATQMALYPGGEPGARPWNRTAYFNQRNRGKLGVTLDFSVPAGKELLMRLAAISDALVENFRASVLDRQGIGWEGLHPGNPPPGYLQLRRPGARRPGSRH